MKKKIHVAQQFEIPATELRHADGRPPTNGYFYPTESWWLGHEQRGFNCRWNFGCVALKDGRFCVDGHEWQINQNKDHGGRQNNFLTREAAIRAACARLILLMRGARDWDDWHGGMTGQKLAFAINWALQKCYAACQEPRPPRKVTIALPPPPPPAPPHLTATVAATSWDAL